MKTYIFRDIYTGELYKVYASDALEAKDRVPKLMNIPSFNLARVQKQRAS